MSWFGSYSITLKVISRNLFILSIALIGTSLVGLMCSEDMKPFLVSSLISLFIGGSLSLITRKQIIQHSIQKKEAFLTVTLSWLIVSIVGCLPYLFSGSIPSVVDAFFESMSGFSTTGASILTDIEILPKSILFWRSLTHWIGGIGIIVLVIIIMPTLQMGGYQLFTLESSLQEKIQPKIKAVGRRIFLIYLLLTFAEVILLCLGGMNLFESLCHSFGTVATGGFSPKNSSIIEYSPYIQYIIMVFMLLAGINFVMHYYFIKGDFRKLKENNEFWFYLFVVALIGIMVTLVLFLYRNKPLEESFREAFFQVISMITCTGFASADYLQWPVIGWSIIFMTLFIGGSTGSTSGGIKMVRHLVVLKNGSRLFKQMLNPNAVIPIKLNKKSLSQENNNSILTFISLYFIVFLIGSMMLVALGLDGKTASSSVATCMAGIGPGIGTVGPVSNYAHLPDLAKLILCILMLMGRLEIYSVLALFSGKFIKK